VTTFNLAISILILDHDSAAANVTSLGLKHAFGTNAQVIIAHSPKTARHVYATQPIDMVIIDPLALATEMLRLLTDLQQNYPEIILLVLTSYDTPRARRQLSDLGIQHYLAKPIDLATVLPTVNQLLHAKLAVSAV
jgi:DNA-binding NtrC family response regulator